MTHLDGTLQVGPRLLMPYPAYKDSGAQWLGRVPAHWEVKRLKRVFGVVNGATPKSSEERFWDGDILWVTPDDLGTLVGREIHATARTITNEGYESCGTSLVPAGSLILSTRAPIGHLALARTSLCTNQGCRALVPLKTMSREYFFYQIVAARSELQSLGDGSTFVELAKTKLETVFLVEPPLTEQRAITGFLDRETAKIDALVVKKERLIELLTEKRAALIHDTVTRGLDPTVTLKQSGVKWLGMIPAHWTLSPLMRLTPDDRPIMYGIVLPGPNVDDGVPIVKGGDVSPDRLRLDVLNRTTREIEAGYARSRLRGGDIVYAIRGSIGMAELVPAELEGANLTQDAARVAYRHDVDGRWLLYALKSWAVFSQLEAGAQGATIQGVNIYDLKRAVLPVPPSKEQFAISKYLADVTGKIDGLIGKVQEGIYRLMEYRSALVSAAVTGKIDVRGEGPAGEEAVPESGNAY